MNIHQMQVRYQPGPDRVLWQVRTSGGELFAVWLTRRMLRLLWPPLQQLVTRAGVARVLANTSPAHWMPEAQAMLTQAARERPLPTARFNEVFDTQAVSQPLGADPLLPEAIDLGPVTDGQGLQLQVREAGGRRLALKLNDDLATALLRLLEQALGEADWGLPTGEVVPSAAATTPVVLN